MFLKPYNVKLTCAKTFQGLEQSRKILISTKTFIQYQMVLGQVDPLNFLGQGKRLIKNDSLKAHSTVF